MVSHRQSYLRTAEALVHHVWDALRTNGPLSPDEHRLASILLAHPEWQRYWDGRARVPASLEADPGRNPFLHVHLHDLIERQALDRKPAIVADTLAAAGDRPDRRSVLIHRIMPVLWFCLTDALRTGSLLRLDAYAERVRGLRVATAPVRIRVG